MQHELQRASRVVLVRPTAFGLNPENAATNPFAAADPANSVDLTTLAAREVDQLAAALDRAGVEVIVVEDSIGLPDSVFPNNWFSWHELPDNSVTIVIYPMLSDLRQREREIGIIDRVVDCTGARTTRVVRLDELRQPGRYLEGTGSLVLDRAARVAFACRSSRTDETLIEKFCDQLGYRAVVFEGNDGAGVPIYHTNVMMWIGRELAGVCFDAMPSESDRRAVRAKLESLGKECIALTVAQIESFAGNMLELAGSDDGSVFAMSEAAAGALTADQTRLIEARGQIVAVAVPTIERIGGGSVRCMIAEVGTAREVRRSG